MYFAIRRASSCAAAQANLSPKSRFAENRRLEHSSALWDPCVGCGALPQGVNYNGKSILHPQRQGRTIPRSCKFQCKINVLTPTPRWRNTPRSCKLQWKLMFRPPHWGRTTNISTLRRGGGTLPEAVYYSGKAMFRPQRGGGGTLLEAVDCNANQCSDAGAGVAEHFQKL